MDYAHSKKLLQVPQSSLWMKEDVVSETRNIKYLGCLSGFNDGTWERVWCFGTVHHVNCGRFGGQTWGIMFVIAV